MDGVITSEDDYWLAAELVVLELLYSNQFLRLKNDVLRTVLFKPGRAVALNRYVSRNFIGTLRNNGINTNWDLAFFSAALYIVELLVDARKTDAAALIGEKGLNGETLNALGQALPNPRRDIEHIDTVAAFFKQFLKKYCERVREEQKSGEHLFLAKRFTAALNAWQTERTGIERPLFERNNEFWQLCRTLFQERYLGDELFKEEEGERVSVMYKDGMIYFEMPIIPLAKIIDTLGMLKDAGLTLGVATGRPWREIMIPLDHWGLLHFFEEKRIATYREIHRAEQWLHENGRKDLLAKPHPFVYLRSMYPDFTDEQVLNMDLPVENGDTVLIVGDSAPDLIAARAMGCRSAVVMTGVKNLRAAQYMKSLEPDIVLDDVSGIKDLF